MMRTIGRLLGLGARNSRRLPHYSYWEVGGHAWGEAVWSILHRAPIRSNMIPNGAHKVLNLWGPNGHLRNTRWNRS